MKNLTQYVLLLRGINVGGNKKVPMAQLKKLLEKNGYENVKTLLASGNVVLETAKSEPIQLRKKLEKILADAFGFSIPVIVRTMDDLAAIKKQNPFKGIKVTPATRLYVTFFGETPTSTMKTYTSPGGGAFRILRVSKTELCSVAIIGEDRSTVDLMGIVEKEFGKNVTTRNWNTVEKILALS